MADIESQIRQNIVNAYGLNANSYQGVYGQATHDWANQFTSQLGGLSGYYDQNQVNSLLGSLGGTSTDTLNRQLQASIESANQLYNYTNNPGAAEAYAKNLAARNGGIVDFGGVGYRIDRGYTGSYDFMGNLYKDFASGPLMGALYNYTGAYRDAQTSIISQIQDQTSRENNFIGQINSIVRDATLKKTAAEQAAQQAALQQQYNQQQAALNAQAQQNAAKLTEQQKAQDAQYAQAQQQAQVAAAAQTKQLNETALLNAQKAATGAQSDQAQLEQSQLEADAQTVQGGEAIVSTNADEAKRKGLTTRTSRWQATRSPAAGGGGIRA